MKKIYILLGAILTACTAGNTNLFAASDDAFINKATVRETIESIKTKNPAVNTELLTKGVEHAASLWRAEDGSPADFKTFAGENYIADPAERLEIFQKISNYIESLYGHNNEITLSLRKTLDESGGKIRNIDEMFGSYSPGAHLQSDFYENKIAFVIALNFPYYTLGEKEKQSSQWTRTDWAMARLGDMFVSREPAELNQNAGKALGASEMYIASYNIYMGHLRTNDGRQLFPDNMVLLSHWNLRDEIKADYADKVTGAEKQDMIYRVMERIIYQDIPQAVINSPEYEWAPYSNQVTKAGKEVKQDAEPDTRYKCIIDNFNAMRAYDAYNPEMNTFIERSFSGGMEIKQEEVEALFDSYLKSPLLATLGAKIKQRLGRDLKPYDIWYDGFKVRSTIPEDFLTSKTRALYPTPQAFNAGMKDMLIKLGWSPERAAYIAEKIVVDPARGSGHAWGAAMKGSKSHLRTRISPAGMDYKGYNIAVHEFGHNVEQTISMYDVDNYMMASVPNTAFTEALAFVFQARDLMLLDVKTDNPEMKKFETFDEAWSLMEIMGVGLVDMDVWKWMYAHPQATPAELKAATIDIAKGVWNKYYAPVFGIKDSPILAIYSHMVDNPLYLANYSYGQIIKFQLEEYLSGKDFSDEIDRIYKQGRLTPQCWMQQAVGQKLSTQPILNALEKALNE
ncbi:MAG TPA: hypothetical protein PLP69_07845 [Bacteroidales bacterium]|nr:hypothetical protein [Bacteroidales bacterium]